MASTTTLGRAESRATAAPDGSNVIPLLVAAVCGAEVVLVFVHLGVGVLLEAGLLAIILALQARSRWAGIRAIVPIALVPLLRLLSLTTPLPGVPTVYWLVLAGVPLAVGGVLAARAAGLSLGALGVRRTSWIPQVSIALLGLPAGYVLWRLVGPLRLFDPGATPGDVVITVLLLVAFAGVVEEFIFRGVIQSALSRNYAGRAVLLAGILYGSTYLGSLSFEYAAFMSLMGMAYGFFAHRTGSILGVAASHALLVVGATLLYPAL